MSKQIELVDNPANGIDLIVERDAGNPVRILTGAPKYSIEFYQELRQVCGDAILDLKGRAPKK